MNPVDEHDRALLANVQPPEWTNPEPRSRYHLVVVGGGTAGLVSAAAAAGLGARVALVERASLGGDCLNVGCVPSKGVIRAARAFAAARGGEAFGAPIAEGEGDFAAAMTRMRRLRAEISHVDGAARFRDLGVDVFLGSGRFTGPDRLEVDGAPLRFRRAVIASGARAALPPIPGLGEAEPRTNETIFDLEKRPARLAVIGAGPIGCELSQAFRALRQRSDDPGRTVSRSRSYPAKTPMPPELRAAPPSSGTASTCAYRTVSQRILEVTAREARSDVIRLEHGRRRASSWTVRRESSSV